MNVSQEELAFRAELDRTYVSGVERQKRNPTIKSLSRIIITFDEKLNLWIKAFH